MSTAIRPYALPAAMQRKLRQIRRRQLLLLAGRAIAIGASALILAMLTAMLVDWWFTLFDPGSRTALTVAALVAATLSLVAATLPRLLEASRTTNAATSADRQTPQLEERWTTVAGIAHANHQPSTRIARAMLEQVTSEAVALQSLVRPSQVAPPASLRPAWALLVSCLVLLTSFLAIDWPQTSVLLRRFWSPQSPITATQLRSTTGDRIVPRGESLDLFVRLSGVPRRTATLEVATGAEIVDRFALRPDEEQANAFVHQMQVEQSFRYRLRAGDARTPWHTVTAIDYPDLEEVQLTVTPPDYVDLPPYQKSLIPSRIKAIQGSRLTLRMKPVEPLRRLELAIDFPSVTSDDATRPNVLTLAADSDGWHQFDMQLLEDLTLALTLISQHGLTNADRLVCRIEVENDRAPVARILNKTEVMVVAPDNVIEIPFEAHDDHGIATAELVIYDESGAKEGKEARTLAVQPIPLGERHDKRHLRASARLDLNQLGLREGTSISYAIRVTDNRQVTLDPDDLGAHLAGTLPVETQAAEPNDAAKEKLTEAPMFAATEIGVVKDAAPQGSADKPVQRHSTESPPSRSSPTRSESNMETDHATLANDEETTPSKSTKSTESAVSNADAPGKGAEPETSATALRTGKPSTDKRAADAGQGAESGKMIETAELSKTTGPLKSANSGARDESNPLATTAKERSGSTADGVKPNDTDVVKNSDTATENDQTEKAVTAVGQLAMRSQQSESGQNTESDRQKVRISQTLTAVSTAASDTPIAEETPSLRERVVRIDTMLAAAERGLNKLIERELPDAERSAQFQNLDEQLGDAESEIATLHEDTKEGEFAFVGLQMVDIGRTHVSRARERTFLGIREPLASENSSVALQGVVRARELLAALLKRYDRVVRDRQLAQNLADTVEMYEVYVEKMQQLMREARQNKNPLQRKMAAIEVDQDYLDRYAEILTLRREMLAELARMLGDDPRLLARYLDLTRRRRASLRDQLTELAERQGELAAELAGWREIDPTQRDVLWSVVAEVRLQTATALAKDAAELSERIEKQLPLSLEKDRGASAVSIQLAQAIAQLSRQITFDAKQLLERLATTSKTPVDLRPSAERLVYLCDELAAALDQLNFDHEGDEEVASFVASRLLESRTVADQANDWLQITEHLRHQRYHGLAEVDQHKLAIATELLRVDMQDIEADLQGEFQRQAEANVPSEILEMARQLQQAMETITFHQVAATYSMTADRLEDAALQQAKGVEEFARAEKLFDQMRRAVVAALDEYDPINPNIADLVDPTLDEFLAQLEREPNLEAQLGIPDRPRNLRVIAETMDWQSEGGEMLGQSSEQAAARAREAIREGLAKTKRPSKPEREMTDQERQAIREDDRLQQELEKSLASIEAKAKEPETTPEQRRQLEQMADNMKRMLANAAQPTADAEQWQRIAEADQARSILGALARGDTLPDEQWNKLLSTLDDGLWQVRDRTPPEDYRKSIEQYQDYLRQVEGGGNP